VGGTGANGDTIGAGTIDEVLFNNKVATQHHRGHPSHGTGVYSPTSPLGRRCFLHRIHHGREVGSNAQALSSGTIGFASRASSRPASRSCYELLAGRRRGQRRRCRDHGRQSFPLRHSSARAQDHAYRPGRGVLGSHAQTATLRNTTSASSLVVTADISNGPLTNLSTSATPPRLSARFSIAGRCAQRDRLCQRRHHDADPRTTDLSSGGVVGSGGDIGAIVSTGSFLSGQLVARTSGRSRSHDDRERRLRPFFGHDDARPSSDPSRW